MDMPDREVAEALAAAYETLLGPLTPAVLGLALRQFLEACGLHIERAVEMTTPAVTATEFTGTSVDEGDFLVRVETFNPGTLVAPPAGAEPHICAVPFSVTSYLQGACPRCGKD
jgi:hypothetical protein